MEATGIFITAAIIGLLMTLGIGYLAAKSQKIKRKEFEKTGQHAEGYYINKWMSIGIPFGIAIGLPFGILLDNIALGISISPAIGVAIGLGIGGQVEKKHKDKLRPLTEEEKKLKQRTVLIGTISLFLGVIAFALIYMLSR